jgi:hypothetical protein
MAVGANAQWSDNFDGGTYGPAGTSMNGQGGWKQWDSAPNTTSLLESATTGFVRSAPFSLSVDSTAAGTSDLVHEFTCYTSGQWTFTAYNYIPTGTTGKIYFLLLNTYNDFGPYGWSVQLTMDPALGTWSADNGTTLAVQGPMVYDSWIECKALKIWVCISR